MVAKNLYCSVNNEIIANIWRICNIYCAVNKLTTSRYTETFIRVTRSGAPKLVIASLLYDISRQACSGCKPLENAFV